MEPARSLGMTEVVPMTTAVPVTIPLGTIGHVTTSTPSNWLVPPGETRLLTVDGSSGNIDLERAMAVKLATAFEVFKERQKKYGSNNIARRGAKGVIVRLDDKLARLEQLCEGKGVTADDETVADTIIDGINYFAIAGICLNGEWPPYKS